MNYQKEEILVFKLLFVYYQEKPQNLSHAVYEKAFTYCKDSEFMVRNSS